MGAPVRYPYGVTNVGPTGPTSNLLAPDPAKIAEMWIDFTGLDYLTSAWTVTETQAGATQNLAAADAAGEFGVLALVNTAGATDLNSIQLTTAPYFWTDTTKQWWLRGRISRDNADEGMGFGMQAVNATPFTLVNGLWMSVAAAATAASFSISKASTATSTSVAAQYPTSALNTFVELAMQYNGNGVTSCYVNGAKVAELTSIANFPNTVPLTPTISSINSSTNARTVHMDYFYFAVER